MQLFIRQSFLLVLLLGSLTTLAQNGPPTIEQVRGYMNRGGEAAKTPPVDVFKTEVRKVW